MTPGIVVGVDGSAGGEAAFRFALEEASLRDLPVRVVCAWQAPATAYVGEAFAPSADGFLEAEHHAEEVLRTALDRVVPDATVRVEALSVEGHPGTVLIDQAQEAVLLVVGSRGRGAATSLLLGSVSQSVAHHARCPLVIVPERP